MTKINVMLIDSIPGSIGFQPEQNKLMIYPDQLVYDLDIRFHDYANEIKNPKNITLRNNFEIRFDFDNSATDLPKSSTNS